MPQPRGRPTISEGYDGWFHCYVTVGQYPNGRPRRTHIRRKTMSEVKDELDRVEARLRAGSGVAAKVETVGQWLEHWLENVVKPARAAKTYAAYRPIIRMHLVPLIGPRRLDGRNRLEVEHVEQAYAILRSRGMASLYVLQCHRVLHKALKDAHRRGRASRNVCDLFDPPQARAKRVEAHSLDDAQRIITTAIGDPWAPRWLIGITLGLRQGEVLGLRWNRLHLDARVPHLVVEKQAQRHPWQHGCDDPHACGARRHRFKACPQPRNKAKRCSRHQGVRGCPAPCPKDCTGHASICPKRWGGGILDDELKSEKSGRDVPLFPELVDMLRAHREAQIRDRADLRLKWDAKGYVFAGPQGQPVDARRDYGRWQQLLERTGLPPSRLHAGRHTAGTLALATGTDIRLVQALLGHSNVLVTEGYTEVALEMKAEAVARVADALFNGALGALVQQAGATAAQDR